MARDIIDQQAGQAGSHEGQLTVIKVDGQTHIALPETDALGQGDLLRDGQDLILQSSDGREIVIEDYFSALTPPALSTTHGSLLTPDLVQSFIKAQTLEYAAQDTANDASAVGNVREVSGEATVTRSDGSSEKIVLGTAIHQGDIVETTAGGSVNIVFIDESSFAISSNARMTIDEYVFDPAAQSGETSVSILRGIFLFTSGMIGRDDPDDVQIDTPVGSIGIRGTTIAGHINPDGESHITVVEGAIVIKNATGEVTLDEQYETVTLTGHDSAIEERGTIDSDGVRENYGSLQDVSPTFFNTLNETSGPIEGTIPEAAPEATTEAAPEATPADAGEIPTDASPTPEDPAQPAATEEKILQAPYDIYNDPQQASFDQAVRLHPESPYEQPQILDGNILSGASIMLAPHILPPPPPPPPSGSTSTQTAAATGNTVEPAMLPPLELVVKMRVDDDAVAGSVVGVAYTTLPYPGAVMQFINVPLSSATTPMFQLLQEGPGVYKIILTADGAADILSMSLGTLIGSVVIGVRLADGRMNSAGDKAIYNDFDSVATGPLPPPTLHLDTMGAGDGQIHYGVAGKGYGFASAFLGDYNKDGNADFAVATSVSALGFIRDDSGSLLYSVNTYASDIALAGGFDINGDGKLDMAIGLPATSSDAGELRIRSGATGTSTENVGSAGDKLGSAVAMIDFNGNGYADVFVGAEEAGGGNGAISFINGNAAFSFSGAASAMGFYSGVANSVTGVSLTGLADYNNDGFGDLAVAGSGTAANGFVKIFLGNATGNASGMLSVAVPLIQVVSGDTIPLHDLGDLNGDGRSDLMIDASAAGNNAVYITFGGSGGALGLTINSAADMVGAGSAGDFNGDGYDDIFVAIRTGNIVDAFVIYGDPTLSSSITLDPNWVTNNPGAGYHMTIDLAAYHGSPGTIAITGLGVGDQNADGFEDLLISSAAFNSGDGGYFVVYGRGDPFDLAGPNPNLHTDAGPGANAPANMVASSHGDALVGSGAANTMSNMNGSNIYNHISFQAGAGNDMINLHGGGTPARVLDGGSGYDVVNLLDGGGIDFRNLSELNSIEEIRMAGSSAQTLTLGLNDIFTLLQSSDDFIAGRYTLKISETGDVDAETLVIDNPGVGSGPLNPGNVTLHGNLGLTFAGTSSGYHIYHFGTGYQVMIDQDIVVNVT